MSKKRLYKKNIKTKKIKGGENTINPSDIDLKIKENELRDAESVPQASTAMDEKVSGVEKVYSGIKNIKIKFPLSPEDKFNQALLKLRTNPQFREYFTSTINNVLVSEFYKILTQLGQYSKNYSDAVQEVAKETGLIIVDEDNDFYSEINSDSTVASLELPKCEEDVTDTNNENINMDKITEDENITEFLEDAMIINVPVIEEVFGKLNKVINKYKILRRKINTLIEKAEAENDAETYFKDFRLLSDEAIRLVDAIFYEFDTGKKNGGTVDVLDDFNSSMLYMCNRGKKNFSKLLKLKLSRILNKIIVRLYDIANMKNIINDEEEIQPRFLETQGESDKFDIGEYKDRISERMNLLEEKEEALKKEKAVFDEKEKKNKTKMEEMFERKPEVGKPDEKKTDGKKITGGFMPEKYKEQANAVSDMLSSNDSQIQTENENLEIVKFQEIVVKIVKKLFCKILDKNYKIDLEPFKKIVIPAFKEKQKEFENLEKILAKDFNEKKELNKKNGKPVDTNALDEYKEVKTQTMTYMKYIKQQMEWAKTNQDAIKEYIKSKNEKQKEQEEALKKKAKEEALKKKTEEEEKEKTALKKAEYEKEKEKEKLNQKRNKIIQGVNLENRKNLYKKNKEESIVNKKKQEYLYKAIENQQKAEATKIEDGAKTFINKETENADKIQEGALKALNEENRKNLYKKNKEESIVNKKKQEYLYKAIENQQKAEATKIEDGAKTFINKETENADKIQEGALKALNEEKEKANKIQEIYGGRKNLTRKSSSRVSRKTRRHKRTSR